MGPKQFFIVTGAILCLSGVAQVFFRPRGMIESTTQRLLNRATLRALVFVAVGLTGILLGSGVLPVDIKLPGPPAGAR